MLSLKLKGNDLFKSGDFKQAIDLYTKAIDFYKDLKQPCNSYVASLPLFNKQNDKENIIENAIEVDEYYKCLNNRSLCYLKMNDYTNALIDTDKVLNNVKDLKALYRRSQAFVGLKRLDDALRDANELVECEPENQIYVDHLQKLCGGTTVKPQAKSKPCSSKHEPTESKQLTKLKQIKDIEIAKEKCGNLFHLKCENKVLIQGWHHLSPMNAFSCLSTGILYTLDLNTNKTNRVDIAQAFKIKPCELNCIRVNNVKNEIVLLVNKCLYKLDFNFRLKKKANVRVLIDDDGRHFFTIDEQEDQFVYLYCEGNHLMKYNMATDEMTHNIRLDNPQFVQLKKDRIVASTLYDYGEGERDCAGQRAKSFDKDQLYITVIDKNTMDVKNVIKSSTWNYLNDLHVDDNGLIYTTAEKHEASMKWSDHRYLLIINMNGQFLHEIQLVPFSTSVYHFTIIDEKLYLKHDKETEFMSGAKIFNSTGLKVFELNN